VTLAVIFEICILFVRLITRIKNMCGSSGQQHWQHIGLLSNDVTAATHSAVTPAD
jgi:hypothetical protein